MKSDGGGVFHSGVPAAIPTNDPQRKAQLESVSDTGARPSRLIKVQVAGLQHEINGLFLFFQTASMLALVLSCSFLFPSLDICRNASTP